MQDERRGSTKHHRAEIAVAHRGVADRPQRVDEPADQTSAAIGHLGYQVVGADERDEP
jgi:hypothetical protein